VFSVSFWYPALQVQLLSDVAAGAEDMCSGQSEQIIVSLSALYLPSAQAAQA
jgi:hypothetical protein